MYPSDAGGRVRNLYNLNGCPNRPTRIWAKTGFPLVVIKSIGNNHHQNTIKKSIMPIMAIIFPKIDLI